MTNVNKKILVLGYLAKVGERTVNDIAKNLALDHSYVHHIVRQMVDDGLLARLEPIINEKGAPAKPIRMTLPGLREIFTFIMTAEEGGEQRFHARYSGNLAQGTATIREIIERNCHLHPALSAYLSFFDTCSDELFRPDPGEEEPYQNTRWVICLTMIIRALILALPEKNSKENPAIYRNYVCESVGEWDTTCKEREEKDDLQQEVVRESSCWEFFADRSGQQKSFPADLFFELDLVVSEIERASKSMGRQYGINLAFSEEILPLFKPFEKEIAERIQQYEKRGAHLSETRHLMACIDPGSFACIPKRRDDQFRSSS